MSDNDVRLIISADLNADKSIKNINQRIKEIENHPSLKAIRLKIDVDQTLLNTLKEFNKNLQSINQLQFQQSKIVNNASEAIENSTKTIKDETKAIEKLNYELKENKELREKIRISADGNSLTTTTTSGNKFRQKTESSTNIYDDNGNFINRIQHASTETFNYEALREAEKNLERFVRNSSERLELLKKIFGETDSKVETLSRSIKELNVNSTKTDFNNIEDQLKKLEKQARETEKILKQQYINEQKYARMQQDTLNKIETARMKFGHHKGVNEKLDALVFDTKSIKSTDDFANGLRNINSQIGTVTAGLKAMRQESVNFAEGMRTALVKFPIWMAATTAFYAPLRGLQQAVDTILEVDKQITELKRVMDEDTNFENLLRGSIELSKELGRSITEVNEALTGFARQGFSESEILDLTKSATLAQNISELTADEAMDALTAAMTVFNIEASKSIEIVDRLNEIDNNMAVTSKDLAVGMQKSASAAATFGVNINELLGDLAAILQITRESGSVAGNSLKTIYSRLTTMDTAIDALASIGIDIHKNNDELKTATEILDEVAIAFKNVNEETKQNVAVALAGRYQLSRFLALVNNREIAHEATAYAINSENSAMRENAAYMESYEARINKMKSAWQELALTMGDAIIGDTIITLTSALTGLANVFTIVVDKVGVLPPILGGLATTVAMLSPNFRTATIAILTFGKGLNSLGVSAKAASGALKSLGASTIVGAVFVGLGIAVEGIIKAFSNATQKQEEYFDNLKNNLSETKSQINSLDNINSKLENSNLTLEERNELYKELAEIVPTIIDHYTSEGEAVYKQTDAIRELVAEERKRLLIKKELAAQAVIDELSTKESSKQIKQLQNEIIALEKTRNQAAADTKAGDYARDFLNENPHLKNIDINDFNDLALLEEYNLKLEQLKKEIKQIYDEMGADSRNFMNEFTLGGIASDVNQFANLEVNLIDYENALDDLNNKLNIAGDKFGDIKFKLKDSYREIASFTVDTKDIKDNNVTKFLQSLSDTMIETNDFTQKNAEELSTSINRMFREIVESVEKDDIDITKAINTGNFDEIINKFPQYTALINSYADTLSMIPAAAKEFQILDESGAVLARFKNRTDLVNSGLELLHETMEVTEDGIVTFIAVESQLTDSTDNLAKVFVDVANEIAPLNQLLVELANGKKLTTNEIIDLIDKENSLIEAIEIENGIITINKNSIEKLRDAKKKAFDDMIKARELELENQVKALNKELEIYDIQIQSIEEVAKAKEALAGKLSEHNEAYENLKSEYSDGNAPLWLYQWHNNVTEEINNRMGKLDGIVAAREQLNTLKGLLNTVGTDLDEIDKKNKSNSSKTPKDDPKQLDATRAKINAINKEAEKLAATNDELAKSIESLIASGKYNNALSETEKLYRNQKKEINLLIKANKDLLAAQNDLIKNNSKYKNMSQWLDENGEATVKYYADYNKLTTGSAQEAMQKVFDQYQAYAKAIIENQNTITEVYNDINNTTQRTLELIQTISDETIASSNRKISLLGNINTQEEKSALVKYTEEIIKTLQTEKKRIFNEIAELDKIINNPKTSEPMRQIALENRKKYADAGNEVNLEIIQEAENLGKAQAEELIHSFNETIEELEFKKSLLGDSDEDKEKIDEINRQILQQRISAQAKINAQIIELERKLSAEISKEERMRVQTKLEYLQDYMKEYELAIVNMRKEEQRERENWADNVIANYKKLLEQQRDLELDALDEIEKKENELHDKTMKRYKKELDSIKEIIDTQLKALDRENESEDYDREMNKLLTEESEIQDKLNLARLDDSLQGKAKVKELEEQLAKIREQIEDKRRERERTLQRNALEDLLEDREKHISDLEEVEDERHKNELERIEEEKKKVSAKYQAILEDEKYFYEMKQKLMSEDTVIVESQLSTIRSKYNELFSELTRQAERLGTMFSTLNSNFQLDYEYLDQAPTQAINERENDWKEYLENKRKAEAMGSNKGDEFYKLKKRNDELRAKWGFIDGSYDQLKGLKYYHVGGEVGTNRTIGDWLKKYLKSDEVPAILRKKELVLDNPNNFVSSIISSTVGALSSFQPIVNNTTTSNGTFIEKIDVIIEGGVKDGADFAEKMISKMYRKGIRIGRR